MTDFFLRDEDEKLAQGATHLDDVDLVHSKQFTGPWGPALVAVAVKHGEHVCWQCGGYFSMQEGHPDKATEIKWGFSHILLHRRCVGAPRLTSTRGFSDILRGMQARRFMAKSVKDMAGVTEAAEGKKSADSPLITIPK